MSRVEGKRQEPRISQYAVIRGITILTGSIVLMLFAYALFDQRGMVQPPPQDDTVETQLTVELRKLRSAWDQRQRARLLAAAPANAERFAPVLGPLLRRDHELLLEAIEYAGASGDSSLRATLVLLTSASHSPIVRSAAVVAADRLEKWTVRELAAFFHNEETVVAALRTARGRSDLPWQRVMELILADGEAREAALDVIPAQPNHEWTEELLRMAESDDPMRRRLGLRALARTELSSAAAGRLAASLPKMSADDKISTLTVLMRWDRPDSLSSIEALALDRDSTAVQACALHYLELVRNVDATIVRAELPGMAAVAKHFAARCLIQVGDGLGTELLLRSLDPGSEQPEEIVVASRQLLAWLTGLGATARAADFEHAIRRSPLADCGPLPAPGLDFHAF